LGDEEAIRSDFAVLSSQIQQEKQSRVSTIDMFRLPEYRKRLGIGFIMMVGAQATGTQIINSESNIPSGRNFLVDADGAQDYGPLLYKNLGFDTVRQLIIQAGWISFSPIGNGLNALIVDKVGRVKMLGKLNLIILTS
jgi:hypothetical protein